MTNRHDLIVWACNQKNKYMEEAGNEGHHENCNYLRLLEKYGPDYEGLKSKLGWTRGFFDK